MDESLDAGREPLFQASRDDGRARAGAARQRDAAAALPDHQIDLAARTHVRELDVGALGETLRRLEQGTELLGQRAQRGAVVEEDHRVGVAHRDGRELKAAAVGRDRLAQDARRAGGQDRDLVARQPRAAHLDGHGANAPRLDVQVAGEHAGAGLDAQGGAAQRRVGLVEQLGDAADAVAAHLGLAAVGVEHAHARVAHLAGQDREHAVAADAEVAIAERAHDRRILGRWTGAQRRDARGAGRRRRSRCPAPRPW